MGWKRVGTNPEDLIRPHEEVGGELTPDGSRLEVLVGTERSRCVFGAGRRGWWGVGREQL